MVLWAVWGGGSSKGLVRKLPSPSTTHQLNIPQPFQTFFGKLPTHNAQATHPQHLYSPSLYIFTILTPKVFGSHHSMAGDVHSAKRN